AGFMIRCDVACPERAERPPADFQPAAAIRTVAEGTRGNFEEVFAALDHRTLLAAERRGVRRIEAGHRALNDLVRWNLRQGWEVIQDPDHEWQEQQTG